MTRPITCCALGTQLTESQLSAWVSAVVHAVGRALCVMTFNEFRDVAIALAVGLGLIEQYGLAVVAAALALVLERAKLEVC